MREKRKVELCAPVGSWESLSAAIKAGADSVYFGAGHLNMRSHSSANFAKKDIFRIAEKCSKNRVKSYLALNSLIYDEEVDEAMKFCNVAKEAGVSAVIVSSLFLLKYLKEIKEPAHASVQMNIGNFEDLKFIANFADVAVLARELNLDQITNIAKRITKEKICGPSGELIQLEIFIHGALCIAVAGTCSMSLVSYGTSSLRGKCFQNCRRAYRVIDEETGTEFAIENRYVMSPKDLCCIRILDRILNAGVSLLKIEGRGRPPEYVYETTSAYRKALEAIENGTYSENFEEELEKRLEKVFNRGFWHGGYYLGDRTGEWSGISGGRNKIKKVFAGKITNYYPKAKCAEATLQAEALHLDDEILIIGATTGLVKTKISELRIDGKVANFAEKGSELVSFPVPEKVRRGDKIYLLRQEQNEDKIN